MCYVCISIMNMIVIFIIDIVTIHLRIDGFNISVRITNMMNYNNSTSSSMWTTAMLVVLMVMVRVELWIYIWYGCGGCGWNYEYINLSGGLEHRWFWCWLTEDKETRTEPCWIVDPLSWNVTMITITTTSNDIDNYENYNNKKTTNITITTTLNITITITNTITTNKYT